MNKKQKLPELSARSNTYKSSAKLVNTRFYILFITLCMSATLGALSFVGSILKGDEEVDLSQSVPRAKAEAEIVVEAFIKGKPFPIDFAKSFREEYSDYFNESPAQLDYDFLTWKRFEKTSYGEKHYFVIYNTNYDIEINNQGYLKNKVDVKEIMINLIIDSDGVYLAALPYISKVTIPVTDLTFDYGSDDQILSKLPPIAFTKIEEWAKYYLEDDRVNLQLVTPDNNPNVEYVGVGGFTSKGVEILSAVTLNNKSDGKVLNYNDWLIRVRVSMENNLGYKNKIDVDITLTDAETAEPLIVAWGEAGVGVLPKGSNSKEKR